MTEGPPIGAAPLRVMLDTNIADVLLDDPILRNGLRGLLDHGAAEIFITHNVVDEIAKTDHEDDPDRSVRLLQALFEVGARTMLTDGFVLDRSRLDLAKLGSEGRIEAFIEGNDRHIEDALIAGTAESKGIPFVTNERSRGRLGRHLPGLKVMSVRELRDAVNERLVVEGRLDPAQLPLAQAIQSGELDP